MSKKILKRNVSKPNVIVKALTAAAIQQEKKVSSLQNVNRLLLRTYQKLMRKYGRKKIVAGKSVVKLLKNLRTHFIAMAVCISKVIVSSV